MDEVYLKNGRPLLSQTLHSYIKVRLLVGHGEDSARQIPSRERGLALGLLELFV